ncbi:family 2 encapsulin nanocompartment cargo protein polyprenyl transferase [Salinifilum aidingensis]
MSAPSASGITTAEDVLARNRDLVRPSLRDAVDRMPATMRHITGYHLGWWDESGGTAAHDQGKTLRSTLVLLSATAVGGSPAAAMPGAVAVELAHNFSLLHDDVMDGDTTRRHRPTAWRVFGTGAAILAGDALLTRASQVLGDSTNPAAGRALDALHEAVTGLIDGQTADLSFEERMDVTVDECVDMAMKKTAGLAGAACAIGSVLGGASTERIARLERFGHRVGLAFQHVDDLLGVWGDPSVTGKPVYSDLRTRKKTLPVVAALRSEHPAGRRLLELYRDPQPLTGADLAHAADLITRAGGRAWSQRQAAELLGAALRELDAARPEAEPARDLGALARLLADRQR